MAGWPQRIGIGHLAGIVITSVLHGCATIPSLTPTSKSDPVSIKTIQADTTVPSLTTNGDPVRIRTVHAPAQECAKRFVEITAGRSACGFSLTTAGVFTEGGRKLATFSIERDDTDGTKETVPADKVVLFPASPSGRFRIVDASAEDGLLDWTFVLDEQTGQLRKTHGGKYGPQRWQSWSEDGAHVVLAYYWEQDWWLHMIDPATGKERNFPDKNLKDYWAKINLRTFTWLGPRSFAVRVEACDDEDCARARAGRRIIPSGRRIIRF